jgi:hypothetical protein
MVFFQQKTMELWQHLTLVWHLTISDGYVNSFLLVSLAKANQFSPKFPVYPSMGLGGDSGELLLALCAAFFALHLNEIISMWHTSLRNRKVAYLHNDGIDLVFSRPFALCSC